MAACLDIPVVDGDCSENVDGDNNNLVESIGQNRYADGIHTYYGLGEIINTFHTTNTTRTVGEITTYPNPVNSNITIEMDMEVAATAQLVVMDFTGQLVSQETISLTKGINTKTMNVTNLVPGMYTIQVYAKSKVITSKFIKM